MRLQIDSGSNVEYFPYHTSPSSRTWNTKRPPLSPFFWPKSMYTADNFLKYIDIQKFVLSAFKRDFKHQTRIGFIEWNQKILAKFKGNCENWLNLMKKSIKTQKIHCAKIWRHPVDIEQQHLESREDWQLPNLLHAPAKTDMNLIKDSDIMKFISAVQSNPTMNFKLCFQNGLCLKNCMLVCCDSRNLILRSLFKFLESQQNHARVLNWDVFKKLG